MLFCTFLVIQQLPNPNSRTTMNHLFAGQIRVGEIRLSKDTYINIYKNIAAIIICILNVHVPPPVGYIKMLLPHQG